MIMKNFFDKKRIIGMIHLKALPGAPQNTLSCDEIFNFALKDLKALQEGGADAAIVENMFDTPYNTKPGIETIVAYTNIFTRLKEEAKIPLGVNIQYTDGIEEMVVATLCKASFIRAETYVENRVGSFGELNANASRLQRIKKELSSEVMIFSDINVKHTFPKSSQTIEYSINEAIAANTDALILTGIETGKSPSIEDACMFKKLSKGSPVIVGSGITSENIKDFFNHIDGVIVGTSVKANSKIDEYVDINKVKELIRSAL